MDGDELMVLKARLTEVEAQIRDVNQRWPAHSVSPQIIMQLEDLEDEQEDILKKIKELASPPQNKLNDLLDEITQKIQSVLVLVGVLREMIEGDAQSERLIEETTNIRVHLDEVEELIIRKFSRECLTSVAKDDMDSDVQDLLNLINKFIR